MSGPRLAVVGATGIVGRELVALLEKRRFPASSLSVFSSGRTRTGVRFRGRRLRAASADMRRLAECDLVFLASSETVARRLGPALARRGVWVIDDSSEFRLDPEVPLVIPEINAGALSPRRRLIAGPNCTMTGLAVAAWPLHRRSAVREIRIASYQAVSGAGRSALSEYFQQSERRGGFAADGRAPLPRRHPARTLPRPIAGNVFPQVGGFDAQGHTGEESKIASELRKIWGAPRLRVSATAVRVPVVRGHSLAAWLRFAGPFPAARARRLLAAAPGVKLRRTGDYPSPADCAGTWPVHVGRVRAGVDARELALWIVSDNLLKGAALNSVQIAERLLSLGWLNQT
ncbi:MAG: aspartate-semialdehyde dehydrogenase [Elusimicrobia bacterium]|nr:aspartate-semialdehyde dehydrogenase [Elusimicrobiota bacterium]